VDVSLYSDKILSKDIDLCRRNILFDTVSLACSCNVLHVFLLIDAGHVSTVQNIVDVLKHLLIDNLSVAEQE
jgi:hypothetical protein